MNRNGLGQGPWPRFSIGIHEIHQGAIPIGPDCLFPQVLRVTCRYTVPDYGRGVAKQEGIDVILGDQDACNLIEDFQLHLRSCQTIGSL